MIRVKEVTKHVIELFNIDRSQGYHLIIHIKFHTLYSRENLFLYVVFNTFLIKIFSLVSLAIDVICGIIKLVFEEASHFPKYCLHNYIKSKDFLCFILCQDRRSIYNLIFIISLFIFLYFRILFLSFFLLGNFDGCVFFV